MDLNKKVNLQVTVKKLIAIFAIMVLFLEVFNAVFVGQSTSGTNSPIYMQNGVINATQININGSALSPNPVQPTRYTLYPSTGLYYAKNGTDGTVISDSNFTNLFMTTENNLGPEGGKIHLNPGIYYGHILINRDGVTVEGEGAFQSEPSGIPDNVPSQLYGSVIVPEAGIDGVHIAGQRYGVNVENLGIQFNTTSTGNGITTDIGQSYGPTHGVIENIEVLNQDAQHYAVQIANFLDMDVENIMSWGGCLIHLYENAPNFHGGNSIFSDLYGYITEDLGTLNFVNGPYPIFMNVNNSISDPLLNMMEFTRLQINNPHAQSDPNYYDCVIWNMRDITIRNIDLEGVNGPKIRMGSDINVEFITPYTWAMSPAKALISVASTCSFCTFDSGDLNTVQDNSYTDTYRNCQIVGSIDPYSLANFVDLPGNEGYSVLQAGTSSVSVPCTFIGENYGVQITQEYAWGSYGNESLKVSAEYGSNDTFTVTAMDMQPAPFSIGFFWRVSSLLGAPLFGSETLLASNTTSSGVDGICSLSPSSSQWKSGIGIEFTPMFWYELTKVAFDLCDYWGDPACSGQATANLYLASGGIPTGSPLATSNNFDVSTLTGSWIYYNMTFPGDPLLQPGVSYFITFEAPTSGTVDTGHQINFLTNPNSMTSTYYTYSAWQSWSASINFKLYGLTEIP